MARSILLVMALCASSTGVTSPSLAQHAPEIAQGPDEVILENGGMLRGTVVTVEPGRAVTLFVMLTGEQRVVPWAEVERVDRGKHVPAEPAPSPAALSSAERERKARELELAHARGERGLVRSPSPSSDWSMRTNRRRTRTARP